MSQKLLLIEDDRELQRLYNIRFKKEKFDVICASDGEEGVQMALREKPDMIILDLMLPKQGGIQVLRILKSHLSTKEIPVLVLTAYDHFNYRKDTQPYVINFVLKTETSPKKIVEIIQEYFEKK